MKLKWTEKALSDLTRLYDFPAFGRKRYQFSLNNHAQASENAQKLESGSANIFEPKLKGRSPR